MLSYWEKTSLLKYDYIVIGSGIVGLSTALCLHDQVPEASILVLERGLLPTGATTRNAGFACIGSLTEILDDLSTMPEQQVLDLVSLRYEGLKKLRTRLGDQSIGYAANGSFELISESELAALPHLSRINEMLLPILGTDAFAMADEAIDSFGYNRKYVKHLIVNNCEGELNSGIVMKALLRHCMSAGIEVKTGAEVLSLAEYSSHISVSVRHHLLNEVIEFNAAKVAFCTNAFTPRLMPELDIKPGRGQVLVTKPIEGLKVRGIFHFDAGYYYFREVDGRVLFGGGRNLDFEGETTDAFADNQRILADLKHKLDTIILPQTPYAIDYHWSGIMAFGADKFPIIARHSERIYMAVRMGGMGVAIGSEAAHRLAQLMLS